MNNIIKYSPNFLEGLSKLTKYITAENIKRENLIDFLNAYSLDVSIIRRIISYAFSMPKILIYLNKYMNNLYDNYDLVDYIFSFRYILQMNNCLNSNRFMFIKSNVNKEENQFKIIDLFENFFQTIYNEYFTYEELLFFYNLYKYNIITDRDILEIDQLLNDGKQTIKLENIKDEKNSIYTKEINIEKTTTVTQIVEVKEQTSSLINQVNQELRNIKVNNCNCKLSNNLFVSIDGNVTDGKTDILLVSLVPNLEDAKRDSIFAVDNIVREQIALFPKEIKWVLCNLISCSIKTKSLLGNDQDVKDIIQNCSKIYEFINHKFSPEILILIGDEVCQHYNINDKMSQIAGTLINDRFIPITHPNNLRNPIAKQNAKNSWKNIQEIIVNKLINKQAPPTKIVVKEEIDEDEDFEDDEDFEEETPQIERNKWAKLTDKQLFLLDVREIVNGKILIIYTDIDGNKYYDEVENEYIGYIKTGHFSECNIITNKVDEQFKMSRKQRWELTKELNKQMSRLK